MSDQKTERLINLTLALLSSKRYLTKSEIFKNVAGYSGSAETMERMFERDKDDLRNLNILELKNWLVDCPKQKSIELLIETISGL